MGGTVSTGLETAVCGASARHDNQALTGLSRPKNESSRPEKSADPEHTAAVAVLVP